MNSLPLDNLTPLQQKTIDIYPTYQQFFSGYSPAQLLVNFDDINTVEESLSKNRITVGDLCHVYPDQSGKRNVSVDYLTSWLEFLNRMLNINKPLIEIQPVAYMIYKDYKYLYLTDFKIIFERILKAEYGVFYGSVDAQLILRAFVLYVAERSSIQNKKRTESILGTDAQKDERTELEKHLAIIKRNVEHEVRMEVKQNYPDLMGYPVIELKQKLISQRLPKALQLGEEEFLKKQTPEKQIS